MSGDIDDFEDDEDELDHFVDAQDTVWDTVQAELRAGEKRTHWMWFVFPVLTGIGASPMAMFYSLRDLEEARTYADHPVLGPRLDACFRLIRGHDTSAEEMLGDTDAYKLRASATLFEAAKPTQPLFGAVLEDKFAGQRCTKTQRLLRQPVEGLFDAD
ncbi:DUF1810 family protein [Salipiger sp. IMCC34102]|uniref:DUF1810 domain-containing protein n=1 Tax=Salipiger sp. IMCC34102 TaxID=2510647 RepID=UPI00101C4A41|nr:DUF1810 family protein [Salipiger sp. IMCC34102]RYH04316.1 DUF1810 family protein [Salipiger sp. IMCC34102]